MGILDKQTKQEIAKIFQELQPLEITFIEKDDCMYCNEIKEMLKDLEEIGQGKISLKIQKIEESNVKDAPVIIITGKNKGIIRYFGIPSGHEFSAFLSTLIDASKGKAPSVEEFKEEVEKINVPVHIKVMVTPQCPHCPMAVKLACDLAILNPNIIADTYEVIEFEDIAVKYKVQSVPKIIINEKYDLVGAHPPHLFLLKLKEFLGLK